jgi:hypothetical protein
MRPPGDEYDEMNDGPGVRRAAGGRATAGDDEVTHFLTELRALGESAPPQPSPQLSALLSGAHPIFGRRAIIKIALRTALIAALIIGALVIAAANHSLPRPAQKVVSHVVNVLTPFHIGRGITPAPAAPTSPTVPRRHPSPAGSTSPPGPRTSPVPQPGGGGSGDNQGGGGAASSSPRAGGSDDGRSDDRHPRDDASSGRTGESEHPGAGAHESDDSHRTPSPSPSHEDDDGLGDGRGQP